MMHLHYYYIAIPQLQKIKTISPTQFLMHPSEQTLPPNMRRDWHSPEPTNYQFCEVADKQ